ncbi:beta-1,3-glucanase family protein [Streptomyces decoyicus]|uniref:beta-1,3-glucanase family protein n=1 Tax=Streptomyces decoyicus TaxID=249567 RepID=UPI0004AB9D38|nr:beta-1,3-glucanase family protein [Streptomyces decoyicus]KOG50658.1 glycosyl hydrolase [Streptomyces decoyicus]QZY15259.1 glycosyl hydrolase [Streptomyces decoyicus]
MITRRSLLGGLAAGAATASGIALAGRATGATAPAAGSARTGRAAAGMPLHLVNNSGEYANSSVWIYIVGNDGTQQVHVTPEAELRPVALADNGPDGFTDYAIPLAAGGTTTLRLPYMSGRIYTALGGKLKFKAVQDGNGKAALAYPAGWVSGDPNYDVLHDCAEFTYNSGGMYCNTTMVDMFSVPLAIKLTGAKEQTTGTLKDGARAKVFSDVRAADGFGRLVIDDKRVIAPGHGLDSGLFAEDYFAPAVDETWSAYAGKDLTVTTDAGTFTGRVSGGKLSFTGPKTISFDKPSTRDVLFCDGTLAAPNDGTLGPVAAVLGAALNRSTLTAQAHQPTTDPAAFYQQRLTNHYARAMHAATQDGKAYGFAFDDVAGFASYIEDGAPKEITLTLTPF